MHTLCCAEFADKVLVLYETCLSRLHSGDPNNAFLKLVLLHQQKVEKRSTLEACMTWAIGQPKTITQGCLPGLQLEQISDTCYILYVWSCQQSQCSALTMLLMFALPKLATTAMFCIAKASSKGSHTFQAV